eukprot:Lithocolla_globosa_v1_NODE_5898_length_1168_cov_76.185085.p1 type:complete len:310 gc:universal NODE_5898_length_1168_cov_76.185085:64-993(+)
MTSRSRKIAFGVVATLAVGYYLFRDNGPATLTAKKQPYFTNKRNVQIYRHAWKVENPKGVVFLVHGFGEHCLRLGYKDFLIAHLNKAGYSVFAHDHEGHGNSGGDRAYFPSFDGLVEDTLQHVRLVIKEEWGSGERPPLYLCGHSMGGLAAILTLYRSADLWSGAILSGPLLQLDGPASMVEGIGAVYPHLPIAFLPADAVSRDQAAVKTYEQDPNVHHGPLKARVVGQFIGAVRQAQNNTQALKTPYLLLLAEKDSLCKIEGGQKWHANTQVTEKEAKVYAGMKHEPFEDPDRDEVMQDILTFLQSRN